MKMKMVLLTALGVGGATLIGSVIGFAFKNLSHKFSDIILSFAAGVMLSAAVLGLILPSVEYAGVTGLPVVICGFMTLHPENKYTTISSTIPIPIVWRFMRIPHTIGYTCAAAITAASA
jgi:zinc transporter ZupT